MAPADKFLACQNLYKSTVNHLVAKYFLIDVFDKGLSNRNCATRIGKGTHYALKIAEDAIKHRTSKRKNNRMHKSKNVNSNYRNKII